MNTWNQYTSLLLDSMRKRLAERGEIEPMRVLYYLHHSRLDKLRELVAGTEAEGLIEPSAEKLLKSLCELAHRRVVAEIAASKSATPGQSEAARK